MTPMFHPRCPGDVKTHAAPMVGSNWYCLPGPKAVTTASIAELIEGEA